MEELIPIIFIVSAAAVLILRPLTKRLGLLIEQSHRERQATQAPENPQVDRLTVLMERMVDRMDRLEDRLDFTERMLDDRRALSAPNEHSTTKEREAERSRRRR